MAKKSSSKRRVTNRRRREARKRRWRSYEDSGYGRVDVWSYRGDHHLDQKNQVVGGRIFVAAGAPREAVLYLIKRQRGWTEQVPQGLTATHQPGQSELANEIRRLRGRLTDSTALAAA